MNKKFVGMFTVFLLAFSMGVSAFGTNSVKIKNTYKDDVDVFFNGVNYNKDVASSRYNLNAIETDRGVKLTGNLLVSGRDFRVELKNIKSISSSSKNLAKKIFVKEGKTFFVEEGENIRVDYENTVSKEEGTFSIYARVKGIIYNRGNGRENIDGIVRFEYDGSKLNIYSEKGQLVLSL